MKKQFLIKRRVFIAFSFNALKRSALAVLGLIFVSVVTASAAPIAPGNIPAVAKLAALKKEGLTKLELHRLERTGKFIIGHAKDGREILVRANSRFASRANKAALSGNAFAFAVNSGGSSLNFTVTRQSNGRIILTPDAERQSGVTYTPTTTSPVPPAAVQVAVLTTQEFINALIPGLFIGLVNSQEAVHPQNLIVIQSTSIEDDPSSYSSNYTPLPVAHSADAPKITVVPKKTSSPQNH